MEQPLAADRDYYEVLGVDRDASRDEVRKAFRKLAMVCHPDRNPGDKEAEARFKEAAEAYEALSDDEKRSRYDRFGKAGVMGQVRTFSGFQDIFSAFGDIFRGGFFDDLFGGRARSAGVSLRCALSIAFEEAAAGVAKTIRIRRAEPCEACAATGAKDGTAFATCRACGGAGSVVRTAGFFRMSTTCGRCGGAGRIVKTPCPECGGEGSAGKSSEVEINIPAGIEDGTRIRLAGEGEAEAPGGPRGDLYCHVRVEPHPFFTRDGDDLVCELPLSYAQAALGAEVEVPTLTPRSDGKSGPQTSQGDRAKATAKLKVKHGTQSGDTFRLRGLGVPNVRTGRRGDLIAHAFIEVPKKLSEKQEDLLRQLAEVEEVEVSPRRRGFLEWIKEQFVEEKE